MPTLPIITKDGSLLPAPEAELRLWGIMRFPHDEQARRRTPRQLTPRTKIELDHLETEDPTERGAQSHADDATAAAFLLGYQLVLAREAQALASGDRAIWLMSELPRKVPGHFDRFSRSFFTRAWQEFRSVAHLWLAYLHLGEVGDPFSQAAIDERRAGDPTMLLEFLAQAEGFRRLAEGSRVGPKRLPLLPARATWKAPAALRLPVVEPEILPLTDQEKAVLQRYRRDHFRR